MKSLCNLTRESKGVKLFRNLPNCEIYPRFGGTRPNSADTEVRAHGRAEYRNGLKGRTDANAEHASGCLRDLVLASAVHRAPHRGRRIVVVVACLSKSASDSRRWLARGEDVKRRRWWKRVEERRNSGRENSCCCPIVDKRSTCLSDD